MSTLRTITNVSRQLPTDSTGGQLQPLLYTRAQAAALLNVSIATLRRLEQRGALIPIRVNSGSSNATVRYRHKELLALAGSDHQD